MEVLLKLCAVSLIGVFCATLLKKTLPEMSVAVSVVTQIALSVAAYGIINGVVEYLFRLSEGVGISDALLTPLIKTVGISVVAKLACDMCRDGGLNAAASYIEIIGGAIAVSFSLPLMTELLGHIAG